VLVGQGTHSGASANTSNSDPGQAHAPALFAGANQ
jgi:hypothetical protein